MAEPDYKELYLKMMGQAERAIDILISAQRDCEEAVLSAEDNDEKNAE